jgi:uncharacterized protein YkwD
MKGYTMKKILLISLSGLILGSGIFWLSAPEIGKEQPTASPKLVTSQEVERELNEYRSSQGLSVLEDNTTLDLAAQERAEGMCATNNWSHEGDWTVLDQYYEYTTAGENLYYFPVVENQAESALDSWVKSPGHLKNIVGDYTQTGVGVKLCPNFQGEKDAVIITNYFGVPK